MGATQIIGLAISAVEAASGIVHSLVEHFRKKGELTAQEESDFQAELERVTSQDHWQSKD